MAISDNLNKSTPTNFSLVFPIIPTETKISDMKPLVLNIFGTIIPALTLDQTEQKWQGSRMQFHSGIAIFDDWTISFIVDSKFENWILLYKWLTFINNNEDIPSKIVKDYMVDASLNITDNYGSRVLSIMFKNVWIQSLGEVTLSYRDGENLIECSATFKIDRYEIIEPTT